MGPWKLTNVAYERPKKGEDAQSLKKRFTWAPNVNPINSGRPDWINEDQWSPPLLIKYSLIGLIDFLHCIGTLGDFWQILFDPIKKINHLF